MVRRRLSKNKTNMNLTSMSVKELKQLRAKVDFLINNSLEDNDDGNYQIFYELLTAKLIGILHNSYPPFPIFKKTKQQYKKLIGIVDQLDEQIKSIFAKPKRIYYRKIYRLYITLVIGDIQDSPLPLEMPIILNYKDKFIPILDKNFPGYLENGLLKVLFLNKL